VEAYGYGARVLLGLVLVAMLVLARHYRHRWLRGLRAPPRPVTYVAQPDFDALCALCGTPVTLMLRTIPIAFMETCMACGKWLDRPYVPGLSERASQCGACLAQERTSATPDAETGEGA
jgi:hypothetical protein